MAFPVLWQEAITPEMDSVLWYPPSHFCFQLSQFQLFSTLVRRQKRMRICLQARQHILTLRRNLRFPQTMHIEADTCRKLAVPELHAAGAGTMTADCGLEAR